MTKTNSALNQPKPAFRLLALGQLGTGFTTYAAGAIMILYLYEPLHLGGLGVDRITATQIMAVFSSLGYFAGIAGSYAADRLFGLRKPYLLGTIMTIVAIGLLVLPDGGLALFVASLVLQIIAAGVTGQSLNALVGLIYKHNAPLRTKAFTMIYIMNNVGAAGPFITGAVAVHYGYNAGFGVALIVLMLTTIPYLLLNKHYLGELGAAAPDPMTQGERKRLARRLLIGTVLVVAVIAVSGTCGLLTAANFSNAVGIVGFLLPVAYVIKIMRSKKVSALEARHVRIYSVFLLGNALTMLIASQSTGIISLYTLDHVNLNLFGWQLSAASFQTIPAILAIIFGIVIGNLGDSQLNASVRYGIGLLLWGAAALLMILPLSFVPSDAKASPLWIVLFDVLMVAGESLTSPIGMSMASAVAPAAFVTQMMTIFTLSKATGSGLAAIAANFYTRGHEAAYFAIIGALPVMWGLLMLFKNRSIMHRLSAATAS